MKLNRSEGFALPAVLISSIVMLIVMLSAITSAVAVRVSLDSQYYNQLTRTAGDAGVAYAKACLAANSGTPKWSDAKPLKPGTDCSGTQLSGFTCPDNSVDSRCVVNVDGNVISSFSVPAPLPDTSGAFTNISANGSVTFLRSSDGGVWRQYKNTVKASKSPLSGIGNGVASSPEVTWKQSESGYWKQVSAGAFYNCAIASNDQVYCWGLNNNGQLGNGTTTQSNVPVAVSTSGALSGLGIKSISAGYEHTCAIATNERIYCWGYDQYGYGVLGNNTTTSSLVPVAVMTSSTPLNGLAVNQVSVGGNHTCAVASDGRVYCWGRNTEGQLGNNSTTQSNVPVAVIFSGVLSGLTIKSLDSGQTHTCAIASNDKLYCWGYNGYGQFGNNTGTNSSVPVVAANTGALSGKSIKSINLGQNYSCAIASDDKAYCWGNNNVKQLGNGLTSDSLVPVAVMTSGVLNGLTIKSIDAKIFHTCAVASDDKAYCWGAGGGGQLGNNLTDYSSDPVAVSVSGVLNGLTIKSIVASYYHTCVVAYNGQTYCWGGNSTGAIGDGTTTNRTVPTTVVDGVFNSIATNTIAAGSAHTCAIGVNGQAYCWGNNSHGELGNNSTNQSNIPVAVDTSGVLSGLTIKSISVGLYHSCAIASNDQAYCWGSGGSGQLGNNLGTQSNVPVAVTTTGALSGLTIKSITAAGAYHTCAIASDNLVYCWGGDSYGQLGDSLNTIRYIPYAVPTYGTPLSGLTIKSITAGYFHTCVVASNNQAYCWGYNNAGQLGIGSTGGTNTPYSIITTGVLSGLTIKSITAGYYHTCAVASNNQAYCWGQNDYGQLGNNSTSSSPNPVAVINNGALNSLTVKSIYASQSMHTCAIASNDQAYCWGYNNAGQLGDNSTTQKSVPTAVISSGVLNGQIVKSLAVGSSHTCAVTGNNQSYCWGQNTNGQLGNNSTTESHVPVLVSTSGVLEDPTFNPISAGYDHNCVIAVDKNAYCWGNNTYGQLGNNSVTQSNVPVPVSKSGVLSGLTIKSISAGQNFTCAIASNDQSYCWGRNYWGQLGNNLTTDSHVPVAVYTSGVLSGLTVKSIVTGYYHACAIASNNQSYCWGYNLQGQLGNSSNADSHVPVAVYTGGVLSGLYIKSISGGSMHNCVIASNNLSYCWGFNNSGQMGNDTASDYSYPVAPMTTGVLSGLTIKSISAGLVHTCAIASNNQSYCWGDNYNGQLGDGTNTIRYRPVATYTGGALSGLTIKYIASSMGGTHTCAIASNDKAYCWGKNDFGQLGDNTTNTSYAPLAVTANGVLNGLTVKSISSGAYHVCVAASNNKPYCWGQGTSGQLGNNLTTNSLVPAPVYVTGAPNWFSF